MFCNNCGNPLNQDTSFCPNCGSPVNNQNNFQVNTNNQMYNNYQMPNNQNEPKKPNILIIIIPIIALLIIAGVCVYIFAIKPKDEPKPNGSNTNNGETNTGEKNAGTNDADYGKATVRDCGDYCYSYRDAIFDLNDLKVKAGNDKEATQNIQIISAYRDIRDTVLDYKDIVIYGKNNNNYPVTIQFDFNVYDDNNYRLDRATSRVNVINANSEFAIEVGTSVAANDFTKYNIEYTAAKPQSYYKASDITSKNFKCSEKSLYGSKTINFEYKNSSKETVSHLYAMIKLYKNNKLVFVSNGDILDKIEPGKTQEGYIFAPKVDYDKFDCTYIGAYYYDSANW